MRPREGGTSSTSEKLILCAIFCSTFRSLPKQTKEKTKIRSKNTKKKKGGCGMGDGRVRFRAGGTSPVVWSSETQRSLKKRMNTVAFCDR
jgi:hypothetical protein